MFKRIAIVNRGGPAVRLIRAARELNEEHRYGIRVIALHTESERRTMFVRAADEAVLLRKAGPGSPYADQAELGRALRLSQADAVWVGWGPVSEDPAFAQLCAGLGVVVIGPSPDAVRRLGDQIVPTATADQADVDGSRHIEVQVIADQYGTVWAPGVRDGSVRRQGRTVIEESSSPALTQAQDDELRAAAIAMVKAAGYVGAGTLEYRYEPAEKSFAFVGIVPCLQVEHPVTEATTGIDIVKLQIHVAVGGRLLGDPPNESGHAIAARLVAQDAAADVAAAPAVVELLRLPSGPGVRVDTGVAAGDVMPSEGDPTIAQIIAWGRDRPEALARLRCALRETTVVLRGRTTTRSFLLDLLDRPQLVAGAAHIGWLDELAAVEVTRAAPHAFAALISVAIHVYDVEKAQDRVAFLDSARGGRPRASQEVGRIVELRCRGRVYKLAVAHVDQDRYRLELDGKHLEVDVDRFSALESRLTIGEARYAVVAVHGPISHVVEVNAASHVITAHEAGVLRAPAAAVVVDIRVRVGQDVEAGQTVAVLESMKMETAVRAPYAGRIRELVVPVNSQLDGGAALMRMDRAGEDVEVVETERAAFPPAVDAAAPDHRSTAVRLLATLQALVTGYDITAPQGRKLVAEYVQARSHLPVDDPELLHGELQVLTTFADLCELSRNKPTVAEEDSDEQVHSPREYFHSFLHSLDIEREGFPEGFRIRLSRVLLHYGVADLAPGPALEQAVYDIFLTQLRAASQVPAVTALLGRWLAVGALPSGLTPVREVLDRLVVATQLRYPAVGDLARAVRFRSFVQPQVLEARRVVLVEAERLLAELTEHPDAPGTTQRIDALVASPQPLIRLLAQRFGTSGTAPEPILEVLTRRYYRVRGLRDVKSFRLDGFPCVSGDFELNWEMVHLVSLMADWADLPRALGSLTALVDGVGDPAQLAVDLYLRWPDRPSDADAMATLLREMLAGVAPLTIGRRVTVTVCGPSGDIEHVTFRPSPDGLAEELVIRGIHPLIGQRLDLWRLKNFNGSRLPSAEDTYLFHLVAKENPADERLVALAEVRDMTPLRDAVGKVIGFPTIERLLAACLDGIRRAQSQRGAGRRLDHNRIFLYAWPSMELPVADVASFMQKTASLIVGAGLDEIVLMSRLQEEPGVEPRDVALRTSYQPGADAVTTVTDPPTEPLRPLDDYTLKVLRSRARGAVYPYELVPLLAGPDGSFVEQDLDDTGRLVPVERPPGRNRAGIVVGVVSTPTARYPEGMTRVALFGDPTKALGSVAEPECALIIGALDLAQERGIPVEWFALSAGARISMDSGTENMDWVARVLRRLITFTQAGGEVNVIVAGINVGAQPYWNAEATMLLHTKGILVMTPDGAMVLTGKQSLDYSGGVSAEDNFGIGGYDRVMGPNGQAQYWAPNMTAACDLLFTHYEHTYVAPGERWARPAHTDDPRERDVSAFPHDHPSSDFTTVGDIFSPVANPDRKKPFDIRTVMSAVVDQDHPVLERWAGMGDADTAVVYDAHLGGHPVTVLGIESRPIQRRGRFPSDGPHQWTAGTLFPRSSKKTARAVNACSGNRPLVVLANLSGFDGSPESLRNTQLEYGAEIGRAMVNFDGPIVFCVISRYHGGAFVVFSGVLNDNMKIIAVEGSFASVIGGAPAAAVVFSGEVTRRTAADPRVQQLEAALSAADEVEQPHLRVELAETKSAVRSGKLGDVAAEFEQVHNIERALRVGSVHAIIPAPQLRPHLIDAVERGMERVAPR
jgi:acetyl/propionyl-CoA carboxylase alpha subunit/acetyl-CoA carboxylase carboxyltransferase component